MILASLGQIGVFFSFRWIDSDCLLNTFGKLTIPIKLWLFPRWAFSRHTPSAWNWWGAVTRVFSHCVPVKAAPGRVPSLLLLLLREERELFVYLHTAAVKATRATGLSVHRVWLGSGLKRKPFETVCTAVSVIKWARAHTRFSPLICGAVFNNCFYRWLFISAVRAVKWQL